ncbi:hypothetical protein AB0387_24300 [Streptomyces sp. NPDC089173]|uniref:hypothetical protein n=1 Tax=Streptomyces sp. NPDC089173 TaxID=3154965 RepID=UPI00344D6953
MTISGYPKRAARCKHGDHPLSQDAPDAAWLDAFGGQECLNAPNPDDGPMPRHEPGSAILSPPMWHKAVTPRPDLEPPSLPYMPC